MKLAKQDPEVAGAWFRDAGKFQAILNLLDTIEITNSDFTIPVELTPPCLPVGRLFRGCSSFN